MALLNVKTGMEPIGCANVIAAKRSQHTLAQTVSFIKKVKVVAVCKLSA
jgi:hypothetical protein